MRKPQVTKLFSTSNRSVQEHTVGSVTFRMVNLPGADNFPIGNNKGEENSKEEEHPRHLRNIAPFALAENPVTQALWEAAYELGRRQGLTFDAELLRPAPAYFSGPNRPVESVSWDDAQEFCRILNLLLDKPKGHFRLPSEAEWEYAARGGERKTLYAGSNQLVEVGWHDEINKKESMPVGLLTPNGFGVYDLSGNVFEWCEDDWHNNYDNHPPDGRAWIDDPGERDSRGVLRGSSWFAAAYFNRCAFRNNLRQFYAFNQNGFRLAAPV